MPNRAIELLGGQKGDYSIVNPNDHVNCSQSTNDVIPTAGKMTSLRLLKNLKKELRRLYEALSKKADEFDHVIKMGRTQMQDAVPIRLGQEFKAYSVAVMRDINRMDKAMDEMRTLTWADRCRNRHQCRRGLSETDRSQPGGDLRNGFDTGF